MKLPIWLRPKITSLEFHIKYCSTIHLFCIFSLIILLLTEWASSKHWQFFSCVMLILLCLLERRHLYSRKITRIDCLLKRVQEIDTGDYNKKFSESSINDLPRELKALFLNLNKMSENIDNCIRERTEELNQINAALKLQLNLEKTIAKVSRSIVKEDCCIDDTINNALQEIGNLLDVDQGFIFQYTADGLDIIISHVWLDEGVKGYFKAPKKMKTEDFAWWLAKMHKVECIYFSSPEELPADAINEIKLIVSIDCKATVAIPLVFKDSFMGFVAFGSTKPKKWEEEQVLLLNLFGEIIAGTLNRQYTMLALEASEARSKAYLKAIPESIFWLDKEGNFLDVKDSPVYTLSIPVSQYPGKNLKDILSVELTQRFLIEINQALANNRVRTFEYKHTKGDKEVFEEARVIRISGNEIMLVIRDITVKKEAHARLLISGEALLKTRQELTVDFIMSTIAHEIKQPLNVIKVILTSTLYLYNKGMIIDTPVLINDIQSVLKQTERINQLINSTASLFHSRKKVAEPVHLGKILESTIQLSAYHIEKLNISVATNLARDIPAIVGNYQHFEQLFINLLENSFAALSNHNIKDKIISIVCRTENNSVIVDFRDNGPGINNNQLEKIFDPFFTTKLENQNRGIGLAIVQSIVRNYNGKISASNAINGGAVFQIHFRIANMNEECIHEYYVS
ncbi:MAG: hypothetical protein CVU87_09270 [Firmicutes bacterium HGW-Firmicutes-12]|nr:MAG: hypothetical protein CVU87_09270 [Firmicutes bacterium HGW-Firmicutes-12]